MRALLVPTALAAILSASAFAFAATHSTNGTVKNIDTKAMTLTLSDGSSYVLPKSFKDPGLKAGEKVSVHWEQKGSQKIADKVMIMK